MDNERPDAPRDESFPRAVRLGRNKNYRYVYRRGRSTPGKSLTLVYLKGRDVKIGFSVSGKVGNAVTRNRLRRWMREDVRKLRTRLKRGKYVLIARPSMKKLAHEDLTREIVETLSRAKLLKEELP